VRLGVERKSATHGDCERRTSDHWSGGLIALEDGERLRQAIAELPPPLKETLVMRDINGLSYRDIAEATGAPIGTVMSRLARARAALTKALRS